MASGKFSRSSRDMSRGAARRDRRAKRYLLRTAGSERKPRHFLVARLGWIFVVTVAVAGGAAMLSWSRTPAYQSSADVLVRSTGPATSSSQLLDMATEKAIALSGAVTQMAAENLGISRHELASGLSVSVPLNTHVLKISYTSSDPDIAQLRASALSAAYVAYSGSDEAGTKASTSSGATQVKATIITAAGRPGAPSSPNHLLDLAVGIVVGLVFGVGTALLRDRLDDRLRGVADLEARIGAPLLAQLPAVRRRRREASPLVMLRAPKSHGAQAYRDLRTRVTRRGAKTTLVTCPASEAKSLVAANLAIAVAQGGRRTVLVCADTAWPRAEDLFDLGDEDRAPVMINTRTDLSQVVRYTAVDGLRVLPASCLESDYDFELRTPMLRWVLGELRRTADCVIVDAPPLLLGADAGALAENVEAVLIVAEARRSTRRHVDAAARQLEHVQSKVIGCVLDGVGRRRRLPPPPVDIARRDVEVESQDEIAAPAKPATAPGRRRHSRAAASSRARIGEAIEGESDD